MSAKFPVAELDRISEHAFAAGERNKRLPWPTAIIDALKERDYPITGREIFIGAFRRLKEGQAGTLGRTTIALHLAIALTDLCRRGVVECIARRIGAADFHTVPCLAWAHLAIELPRCGAALGNDDDCLLPSDGCIFHNWQGLFMLPLPTGRLNETRGEGSTFPMVGDLNCESSVYRLAKKTPATALFVPLPKKPGPRPTERERVIEALRRDGRTVEQLRSEKQEVLLTEFQCKRATLQRALADLASAQVRSGSESGPNLGQQET